jgi:3-hexulose-6-phosphate synthase/6-phospho-3-hexuloisomerase
VDVLGVASLSTIAECVEAARNYGCKIIVDLIEVKDIVERAKAIEKLGANYVAIHTAIDEQMRGKNPFENVKKVSGALNIPVAAAGGVNSETACHAIKAGASIVIVGGAITKASDACRAARIIKKAISKGVSIKTDLYKRVGEDNIITILKKVSTANVSDALHRGGVLEGIKPVVRGVRLFGKAVTVRTYPGDWAKPVEAIDIAKKADVIVIDAGGVAPAVWGELASESAKQKKLGGVVIDGAIRDVAEIERLRFPAFSRIITPNAGEPRGFGEINVPVKVGGVRIEPGDFILGDDDGVVAIPGQKAAEFANRAMDVLEKENRIRREIREGGTLSQVMELLKWEKR